jgi:hypothetical protein
LHGVRGNGLRELGKRRAQNETHRSSRTRPGAHETTAPEARLNDSFVACRPQPAQAGRPRYAYRGRHGRGQPDGSGTLAHRTTRHDAQGQATVGEPIGCGTHHCNVRESRNERDARDVGDQAGVAVQEVRLTA